MNNEQIPPFCQTDVSGSATFDLFGNGIIKKELLRDKFIEPPFSVLNSTNGNWQKRKNKWKPSYVWARAIFIVIAKKNYHSDIYIASFLNKDRTSIINARDAAHKHLSETDYKFINLYTNGHL